jgi:hypothetical protein
VISDRMEPRLSLLGDHFFHRECLRSCYRSQGADLACPRCQARLHTEFFDSVVDGDSPPLLTQSFPLSK